MCGWERKLLRLSLMEAGVNLALSLALVRPFGVLGVAIGTLVPTLLVGWFGIVPLTSKFVETGCRGLFDEIVRPVLTECRPCPFSSVPIGSRSSR